MEPIVTKKIGAHITKYKFWINMPFIGRRASYPLSTLYIFKDHLIIKILGKEFKLLYNEIDYIKKHLFQIVVEKNQIDPVSVDKFIHGDIFIFVFIFPKIHLS